MSDTAVVVIGRGPAVEVPRNEARELSRQTLRADETYRTWKDIEQS